MRRTAPARGEKYLTAKVEMRHLFSPMTPFIIVMFATIVLLAYFPWLSLAIPKAIGGYITARSI